MPDKLRILLILILLRLAEPLQSTAINRYHCDTKEQIDEIRNLKYYLRRLIRHDQKIYFVLSTRVIYMELLLENERIDRDLYDFFDEGNRRDDPTGKTHPPHLYHHLSFDLFEQVRLMVSSRY